MDRIWISGGREYPFDAGEYGCMQRLGEAIGQLRQKVAGMDEEKTEMGDVSCAAVIRRQCETIESFFDHVLGEGEGVKICGDRKNIGVCFEKYADFIAFVNAQIDGYTRLRAQVEARFAERLAALAEVGETEGADG